MGSFKAGVFVEVEKMYRRKKVRVIIVLSLIIVAVTQIISAVVRRGLGIFWNTSSVFPLTVLSFVSNTILPLFTILVINDAFTSEFSHNTMKLSVTRPITRLKIYLAKITAAGIFFLGNLLFIMVLSLIVGVIFNRTPITFLDLIRILIAYVVTIFPIIAFASVIAFFANIFKSPTLVFFISIIFLGFSILYGILFPKFSGIFITTTMDWYKLWIADSPPVEVLLRQFGLILGYILFFITAGYYRFYKRDL